MRELSRPDGFDEVLIESSAHDGGVIFGSAVASESD
jgi:hypothetical protein